MGLIVDHVWGIFDLVELKAILGSFIPKMACNSVVLKYVGEWHFEILMW